MGVEMAAFIVSVKGGRGSGNFGHCGRPGQLGGSGDDCSIAKSTSSPNPTQDVSEAKDRIYNFYLEEAQRVAKQSRLDANKDDIYLKRYEVMAGELGKREGVEEIKGFATGEGAMRKLKVGDYVYSQGGGGWGNRQGRIVELKRWVRGQSPAPGISPDEWLGGSDNGNVRYDVRIKDTVTKKDVTMTWMPQATWWDGHTAIWKFSG